MSAVPDAKSYIAHIYRTGLAEAGFLTSTSKLKRKDGNPDSSAIGELARVIRHMAKAERIDVKISVRKWPALPPSAQ